MAYDAEKMEQATILWLEAIGEDVTRDGLRETPRRVAKMYATTMNGLDIDPLQYIKLFDDDCEDMIVERKIPFFTKCEHHLVEFRGHMTIGYLPTGGKIIGLGKIPRIMRTFCKKPQVQERLMREIHDFMAKNIPNNGVAVSIDATHDCMECRGARAVGVSTRTTRLSGLFKDDPKTRQEFLMNLPKGE